MYKTFMIIVYIIYWVHCVTVFAKKVINANKLNVFKQFIFLISKFIIQYITTHFLFYLEHFHVYVLNKLNQNMMLHIKCAHAQRG